MRRHEKAITESSEIEAIIRQAQVCRLAMCDGGQPYVVPLCFGRLDGALYFHCATEGRKLDILRANPRVCVEFDELQAVVPAPISCKIGTKYRSVIGVGIASVVEDTAEKRRGLEAIVRHYADATDTTIPDDALARVTVLRVDLQELTGKASG